MNRVALKISSIYLYCIHEVFSGIALTRPGWTPGYTERLIFAKLMRSDSAMRMHRPKRQKGSSPAAITRLTVLIDTPNSSATSCTVRNEASLSGRPIIALPFVEHSREPQLRHFERENAPGPSGLSPPWSRPYPTPPKSAGQMQGFAIWVNEATFDLWSLCSQRELLKLLATGCSARSGADGKSPIRFYRFARIRSCLRALESRSFSPEIGASPALAGREKIVSSSMSTIGGLGQCSLAALATAYE